MRFFRRFFLLSFLFIISGYNLFAGDWYVSTSGSNTTGNGTSGNPWQTIQFAINSASVVAGDEVHVAAGTYNESITVTKSIILSGAGMDKSIIKGLKTVSQTVLLAANEIELLSFTVTRDGNNTTDWGTNSNNSGVSFAQSSTRSTVAGCKITGNRNGIYLNNALNISIVSNLIVNNRTGIQLVHNVSNLNVTNNIITGNWTHGFVIYYGSAGQAATTNAQIHFNNISGNWYSQVECKTVVANPSVSYDFTYNWWGSSILNVVNTPAGEPGYTDQIPVQFGGSAVSPGTNGAKICGDLVTLVDYDPYWTDNQLANQPVLSYPVNGSTGHPVRPRLEWDAFPGAYSYDIEISKVQPFTGATSIYYNTTDLYFDIPADLEKNTKYYWRVRARGVEYIDASQWSNAWNFTTTVSGISQTGEPVLTYPVLNATVYDTNPKLYWYTVPYSSGITLYEIEYKAGDDDFSTGDVYRLTSTTIQSQLNSLTGGSTYYWRVRIYNGGLNLYSAWSDVESFTVTGNTSGLPVQPVPSHPINNVVINYDNTPVLYWYVVSAVNDFNFEVIVENTATLAVVFQYSTATGATNTEVTSALTAGSYRWKVRSLKPGFTPSAWSDYAYFTIQSSGGEPQVPIPTHPLNNATVYTSVPTFYWYVINNSPEFTWTVRVQGVSNAVLGYSRSYNSTNTNFQMPEGLVPGEQYLWSVCTNRTGYTSSVYSTPALFTIYNNAGAASKPTASWPVNNAVVYVNPPVLYWYTGSAAMGVTYNIQLQPAGTPLEGSPLIASGLTNTNYQLTGNLTPGTGYHWRVQSVLNGIASDWSTEATFTMNNTMAGGLPQPVLIYPVNFIVYTTTPMLTWFNNYSSAVTKYRITIATDPTLTSQIAGSPFTSAYAWFTTPALVPGSTYYWGIESSDGSSYSLMSAKGEFTVNAGSAPVVPRIGGPDGINLQESSAMLNWYLPVISTSALTYSVEYSTSADFSRSTVQEGVEGTSFSLAGLKANTEYYWRVRSSAGDKGASGYSLAGSFKTSGVTAADEETAAIPGKFEVGQNYPNPFNPVTNIMVNLPENAQLTVKVYNVLGQEVKTLVNREMNAGSYVFQWNGDNNSGNRVPSGIYIYKVTAGANSKSLKMTLLK